MNPAKKNDQIANKQKNRLVPVKADQHGSTTVGTRPIEGTTSLPKTQNGSTSRPPDTVSTSTSAKSNRLRPNVVQKMHTTTNQEGSGSSTQRTSRQAATTNEAGPRSSGSSAKTDSKEPKPHIPVAPTPRPPVFGVGRQDEQGNTPHLGADALADILAKHKTSVAKLRAKRKAEQLNRVGQQKLAVRNKL